MIKQIKYRKYKETFPEEMIKLMMDGAFDCQIARHFKISGQCFYNWLNDIEEFREAHEEGLLACEAWWIERGKEGMMGKVKGFNAMTWIMFMNNKFRKQGWSKSSDNEANQIININQMNVLQSKDRAGLLEYIEKAFNKKKDIINVQLIENKE